MSDAQFCQISPTALVGNDIYHRTMLQNLLYDADPCAFYRDPEVQPKKKKESGQLCFSPGLPAITNKDSLSLARWKNPALVLKPVSSFAFWLNGILSVTQLSWKVFMNLNSAQTTEILHAITADKLQGKKSLSIQQSVHRFSTSCELAWSAPYNGNKPFFPIFFPSLGLSMLLWSTFNTFLSYLIK